MKKTYKRILSGAGALIIALALAIGGTYAYTQFEHKSNPFRNDPDYLGRLMEDYEEKEWDVGTKIKKEISVKNMGGTAQFQGKKWGNIYVRVQLKEHMDITPIKYVYYDGNGSTATRFMIDKTGDFVRFTPTVAVMTDEELTAVKSSGVWQNVIADPAARAKFTAELRAEDFVLIQGYYDTTDYWYVKTKEGDPNGQYGAFVVMGKDYENDNRTNITPTTRATGVDYSRGSVTTSDGHENGECDYAIHYWNPEQPHNCALETHKYASWELGDNIILAADWQEDPKLVNAWILDPVSGWATWGNVLEPGQSTDLLLKSILPLVMPDGQMLYVIHADMQATDLSEMGDDWVIYDAAGGMGASIRSVTFGVGVQHDTGDRGPNSDQALLISSRAQLDQFISEYQYVDPIYGVSPQETISPKLVGYDDAFFADDALILITRKEPSISISHQVNRVELHSNTLQVSIKRTVPTLLLDETAAWVFALEVKKSDVAAVNSVEALFWG